MYKNQHILVLGMGDSGIAAAKLAKMHSAKVSIVDNGNDVKKQEKAKELQNLGIFVYLNFTGEEWLDTPDLIIISPGLARELPLGKLADSQPCEVISELEFGYRYCKCPILAITGTNGKTTTTEIVTHCFLQAGKKVVAAGNIGLPLCEAALNSQNLDYIIVEVSSFQLERCSSFKPYAAVCLNVTPDHLDRHGTFNNYFLTKMMLFRHIENPRHIIVREDIVKNPLFEQTFGEKIYDVTTFSGEGEDTIYMQKDGICYVRSSQNELQPIMNRNEIPMLGKHNVENVLAAFALCQAGQLNNEDIVKGIKTFKVAPHRMELIAKVNNICYINDSKATNIDAMEQSLISTSEIISGKIILIAGGLDKGIDFSTITLILKENTKHIYLIGKCKERLFQLWKDVVDCSLCSSFDEAVTNACDLAQYGDAVLLAPGCASMDMFKNYEERGNIFKNLILRRVNNG